MAFYLFPTGLAPHLHRHSCPIAPGGEGGALWAGGCGESLPPSRREGLLSVLCAPELRLSRDCRGQDAALSPWGSPALEQDDTGSHSHLHLGGWFGLLPPSPGGRYQWGSVLRGSSQAPVVSQGPGLCRWRGREHWETLWGECPGLLPAQLPARGLTAPWPVWVEGTGDRVGVGEIWFFVRLSAGWRVCAKWM